MPKKLTKQEIAKTKLAPRTIQVEDKSDVPENLAHLTVDLLRLHARTGDLLWVYDLLAEAQNGKL